MELNDTPLSDEFEVQNFYEYVRIFSADRVSSILWCPFNRYL